MARRPSPPRGARGMAVNVSRRRFTVNDNEFCVICLTLCARIKLWLVPDMKTKKKKTMEYQNRSQKKRFVFKRDAKKTAAARSKTKNENHSAEPIISSSRKLAESCTTEILVDFNRYREPTSTGTSKTHIGKHTDCVLDGIPYRF